VPPRKGAYAQTISGTNAASRRGVDYNRRPTPSMDRVIRQS